MLEPTKEPNQEQFQISKGVISKWYRFTRIPRFIIQLQGQLGISNNELSFLVHCYSYGDECFASWGTLAKNMNCSVSTVRRYARGLREKELIDIIYRIKEIDKDDSPVKEIGEFRKQLKPNQVYTSCRYDLAPVELKSLELAISLQMVDLREAEIEMHKRLQRGATKTAGRGGSKTAQGVMSKLHVEREYLNESNINDKPDDDSSKAEQGPANESSDDNIEDGLEEPKASQEKKDIDIPPQDNLTSPPDMPLSYEDHVWEGFNERKGQINKAFITLSMSSAQWVIAHSWNGKYTLKEVFHAMDIAFSKGENIGSLKYINTMLLNKEPVHIDAAIAAILREVNNGTHL